MKVTFSTSILDHSTTPEGQSGPGTTQIGQRGRQHQSRSAGGNVWQDKGTPANQTLAC